MDGSFVKLLLTDFHTHTHISAHFGPIHLPLTDGPSVKCVLYKTFLFFHQNLMKLGEVLVYVVHIEYYSIKKFYQILIENKKSCI